MRYGELRGRPQLRLEGGELPPVDERHAADRQRSHHEPEDVHRPEAESAPDLERGETDGQPGDRLAVAVELKRGGDGQQHPELRPECGRQLVHGAGRGPQRRETRAQLKGDRSGEQSHCERKEPQPVVAQGLCRGEYPGADGDEPPGREQAHHDVAARRLAAEGGRHGFDEDHSPPQADEEEAHEPLAAARPEHPAEADQTLTAEGHVPERPEAPRPHRRERQGNSKQHGEVDPHLERVRGGAAHKPGRQVAAGD